MQGTESPLEARLTIAAVGYRVKISRLPKRQLLDEQLGPRDPAKLAKSLTGWPENKTVEKLRRTVLSDEDQHEAWFDTIKRHIRLALKRGAHFVILPEFCQPPDVHKVADVANTIRKITGEFEHEFFLFSGSRHEGAYNRGFIVSREGRSDPITKNWWHYKMASARGLGENIMGPQNWRLPSYNFTIAPLKFNTPVHCRVCVAICYDIFDPTTFINYVVQSVEASQAVRETIILVPSFNPSKEFVHALRDLSFIANCPVIYVNGLHGDAKLFLYGFAISDLVEIEGRSAAPENASRKPTFDEYLNAGEASLKRTSEDCYQEVRTLQAAVKNVKDGLAKRRIQDHCAQIHTRGDNVRLRTSALKSLAADMDRLRKKGALRHLITKEDCTECANETHVHNDYCANDILYYNLDPELILAIKDFKLAYFQQDSFLPLPFRRIERDRIFARITQKKEDRMAKMERKRVTP